MPVKMDLNPEPIESEEEALDYVEYLSQSILRGLDDIENGHYLSSQEEMFAEAARRRENRMQECAK